MLTFVIACADYHRDRVEFALSSVADQTVPCSAIVVYDTARRGSGWARNRGLEQVTTPFVSFLDADDTIAPTFVEACLRAYDGRHYVYTDWYADAYIRAPECAWKGDGGYHIITTLLPTERVKALGGFNETMRGNEDSAFYWKLTRAGVCGKRLPQALFTYSAHGQRSKAFHDSPERDTAVQQMMDQYRGRPMPCCLDEVIRDQAQPGAPQPGDVLAQILYMAGRNHIGRATGRQYTKFGNATQLWMNPADIDASPQAFARVVEMPPAVSEESMAAWRKLSNQVLGLQDQRDVLSVPAVTEEAKTPAKANVGNVLRLYNAEMELTKRELIDVIEGATLEVSDKGVKVKRSRKKDYQSRPSAE